MAGMSVATLGDKSGALLILLQLAPAVIRATHGLTLPPPSRDERNDIR